MARGAEVMAVTPGSGSGPSKVMRMDSSAPVQFARRPESCWPTSLRPMPAPGAPSQP
ncbi:MAG: hypothetical protein R2851_28220 [Caldilineaceae bacterium]